MLRLLALAAALFVSVSAAAPDVVLATFDGADAKTTFKWTDMNDPVSRRRSDAPRRGFVLYPHAP